jgi:peptidoglycan/LPS O-acetylase OafA/YrhL
VSRSGPRLPYEPALDGLRGFGLLFVLAFHGGFATARGSFLWVSMFFTLSGYLVTALALAEHRETGRVDVVAFWRRRVRRLMPGALLTLAAVALFGALFADPTQLARLRGDALAALFYVVNWRFVATSTSYASLFARPAPVQHFWSLSIEEQLYLVHPLLVAGVLAAGRGSRRVFAAAVCAVTLAAVAWTAGLAARGVDIDRLYFGTDTRLAELTAGMLLAVALEGWDDGRDALRLGRVGLVAFVVMLVATFTVDRTARWLFPLGFLACSASSCALIAGARQRDGLIRRLFEVPVLTWLGRLSYTIYLFHWPIFLVVTAARTGLNGPALFVARVAVTLALSAASHYGYERPIRSRRALAGPRAWLAMPAGFAAVAAAVIAVTLHVPTPAVDLDAPPRSTEPPVVARPDTMRILVIGDSQAFVLGRALERWADRTHGDAAVWSVALRGCGVVRGGQVDRFDVPQTSPCDDWDVRWADQLDRFRPRVVVVLSGGWDWVDRKLPAWGGWRRYGDPVFDDHLVAEYGAAADLLASRGATVVWLTPPCHELELVQRDPRHLNRDLIPRMAATRADHVVVYDLYADLCPEGRYTQRVGAFENGRPDGIHLSDDAAAWVAGWLGPKLVAIGRR